MTSTTAAMSTTITPISSPTSLTTQTSSNHPSHHSTSDALKIFIPIGLVSCFLIVVIVAVVWWLFMRVDDRYDAFKRSRKSNSDVEAAKAEGKSDVVLPQYEAKMSAISLPQYGSETGSDRASLHKNNSEEGHTLAMSMSEALHLSGTSK